MVFAHEGKLHRIIELDNTANVHYLLDLKMYPGTRIRSGTQVGLEAP